MGKGERRGGRARAGRARHHHNHFQQRRRLGGGLNRRRGGGGGRGITLNFSGSQGAARYYSAGISLFMISLFLLFSGIPMTVIFSGFDSGNYYPLIMIGIGGALFVASMFMCARAKRKSAEAAATNPTTQDTTGVVGPTGPPQTAGVFLQPAQPTAPDPMYFSGAMPGQPMAIWGKEREGEAEQAAAPDIIIITFNAAEGVVVAAGFRSVSRDRALRDVSLMPLMMFGIGGALLVAGVFLCARGKRRAAKEAATSPAGQDTGTSQPEQTAETRPQPSQGAQPTAPDPTAFGGTIPGQPMADFSYPSAGQPYPGSQPYPGPAAAGGFGPAPSAPAPSGPAPPPQYGFTYNTSDNYNTQYSAGTSDLPPPPAYSTVVNEKL
uniref:Uncharacterized protein n=1 Tax=Branchiostoma floridae TaxID=7739 RepID=C3YWK4_BRAFL|eukprot:XP_002599236.1 hypothetical protein BRAFLDRAFT_64414 [Branchiostoma floridae]